MEHHDNACAERSHPSPGQDAYRAVRGHLIIRGRSLRAVCLEKGVRHQNARDCLLGVWRGPKAKVLFDDLCHEAGL